MIFRRDVFQAIADPTRIDILLLVAMQSMAAGTIASNFSRARPTVSKHLHLLMDCGLLKKEQNGKEIYYHFIPQKMEEVIKFIEHFKNPYFQYYFCLIGGCL